MAAGQENIVPKSLNLAISKSTGTFIARLDVHSKYPKGYLEKLYLNFLNIPNCGNIGFRVNTIAPALDDISICIAYFMSHPVGVGN